MDNNMDNNQDNAPLDNDQPPSQLRQFINDLSLAIASIITVLSTYLTYAAIVGAYQCNHPPYYCSDAMLPVLAIPLSILAILISLIARKHHKKFTNIILIINALILVSFTIK